MDKVLIVPHVEQLDVLVARLVDLLGYEAIVVRDGSDLAKAIEHASPAVVMVDAEHPTAEDPLLLLAAYRLRAPVVLFSGSLTLGELRRAADAEGVGHFVLPNGPRALETAIAEASAQRGLRDAKAAAMRVAQWARWAAHHEARLRWHSDLLARVAMEVQSAARRREHAIASREAASRALAAARKAREQLRAEVTRYVWRLKEEDVPRAALVSRVAEVVHSALTAPPSTGEKSELETAVEQWCVEAYESAA